MLLVVITDELLQAASKLVVSSDEQLTPWDLAHFPTSLRKLFGEPVPNVAVEISGHGQSHTRHLSEELFYGIALILTRHPDFQLAIAGKRVIASELSRGRYISNSAGNSRYCITLTLDTTHTFYFNTPDFIQGLCTACNWTQLKHEQVLSGFFQIADEHGQPLAKPLAMSYAPKQ
jgi:hypothetical protein